MTAIHEALVRDRINRLRQEAQASFRARRARKARRFRMHH